MKTNTETAVLSIDTLRKAVELSELIERSKNELNALLAGKAFAAETPVIKSGKTGKRKLSAEALEAIRLGQKRRWRKVHQAEKAAAKATPVVVTAPPVGTVEPAVGFETPPLSPME
jgi:hypothetical protein